MEVTVAKKSQQNRESSDTLDLNKDSKTFLPELIEWDCCKGSEPRYRGYPCAMWTLFHVLTVSAYMQQSISGRAVNPLEVPLAIRSYMDHFFGCAECSKHFLQMAVTMEQDIVDAKGAVLWLWSAHNKVNSRLKGDQSEDKAFPKVQFPPSTLCQSCHSPEEKNASGPIWNTDSVFKFLISFYMDKNIYVSPTLSEGDLSDNLKRVSKNVTLKQAAKIESVASQVEELDWWEGKQREQDLKKVWSLRNRKKERLNFAKIGEGLVERIGSPSIERRDFPEYSEHGSAGSGNLRLGIFNDLDLSMCIVFYVISTVIILGFYHHFVVRRKASPCPFNCHR